MGMFTGLMKLSIRSINNDGIVSRGKVKIGLRPRGCVKLVFAEFYDLQ